MPVVVSQDPAQVARGAYIAEDPVAQARAIAARYDPGAVAQGVRPAPAGAVAQTPVELRGAVTRHLNNGSAPSTAFNYHGPYERIGFYRQATPWGLDLDSPIGFPSAYPHVVSRTPGNYLADIRSVIDPWQIQVNLQPVMPRIRRRSAGGGGGQAAAKQEEPAKKPDMPADPGLYSSHAPAAPVVRTTYEPYFTVEGGSSTTYNSTQGDPADPTATQSVTSHDTGETPAKVSEHRMRQMRMSDDTGLFGAIVRHGGAAAMDALNDREQFYLQTGRRTGALSGEGYIPQDIIIMRSTKVNGLERGGLLDMQQLQRELAKQQAVNPNTDTYLRAGAPGAYTYAIYQQSGRAAR